MILYNQKKILLQSYRQKLINVKNVLKKCEFKQNLMDQDINIIDSKPIHSYMNGNT